MLLVPAKIVLINMLCYW